MHHGRLRGVVVGLEQPPVDDRTRHRGDVHDRAAAVAEHGASLGLAGQEHPGDVDVDDTLPLREVHVLGGGGVGDARAVHGEPQRAQRGLGAVHGLGEGAGIGDVGRERDRLAPEPFDVGDHQVQARSRPVQTADVGPGLRQAHGEAAPDPARGPGDQGRPVVQPEGDHAVARCMTATSVASLPCRTPFCRPRAEDEHPMGEPQHLVELGADHHDGQTLLGEVDDHVVDRGPGADVDTAGGLVEDDHAAVCAPATWR